LPACHSYSHQPQAFIFDELAEALPYDPASQVTQVLHQLTATSTQINQAAYAYNGVGNRTSLTDRRGAQGFGYDTLDRLTSASHPLLGTPQAFAYDPVGNRTTGGSVVNAGNQLTADATHSYQYDDNGNLTRKTLLATGNYTVYTYDAENRLVKVEDFLAGNPTPTATSTYRYDGLGRRIEKVANGQTRRYVYDFEDILLEYDGTNTLQAQYTHGPGIDEPIAVTRGGSTFFYHQDGLGTVTDLTDSAGSTAKSYSYDAYGNVVDQTGTVEQPYTYTGREFDSESGLLYYRARYYDPTTGRFLQKDPIGFVSGDSNQYNYTRNNPANRTDALGLTSLNFNIKNKTLTVDPEVKGQPPYQLPATSGLGDCQDEPKCARQKDSGPIPQGDYTIDSRELSNPGFLGDYLRNFLGDWGDWRAPIRPNSGTQTFGRSGFLLHGGRKPGSKGCIDVGGGILGNDVTNRLLNDLLNDPDHIVPLTVQ